MLHFVISPCCEIGQVNKPREKSIYASGLKAGSLRKRKGYKRDAWLKLSTHCSFSFHFPPGFFPAFTVVQKIVPPNHSPAIVTRAVGPRSCAKL